MRAVILKSDAAGLDEAAAFVREGGVIVYPTETVYGLAADPFNEQAVHRVYAIKGRDAAAGLILLVPSDQHLRTLTTSVPPAAQRLIKHYWPGPLTLILPASDSLSRSVTGGKPTVAVRRSASSIAAALVQRLDAPITSTSANRSGCTPVSTVAEAQSVLGSDVDAILDGGAFPSSVPSTIVDAAAYPPVIVREGRISPKDIRETLAKEKFA